MAEFGNGMLGERKMNFLLFQSYYWMSSFKPNQPPGWTPFAQQASVNGVLAIKHRSTGWPRPNKDGRQCVETTIFALQITRWIDETVHAASPFQAKTRHRVHCGITKAIERAMCVVVIILSFLRDRRIVVYCTMYVRIVHIELRLSRLACLFWCWSNLLA